MSSVVLLDIWSYILSMIPVARIPTQHSPQEVWLKVWGRVCVYVSLCVSLVLDLCVSLVLEGSNKTFTWYDMFFTSKKNLDISPFIITFFSQDTKRPTIGPRFDGRNPTNSSGSLAVGVGGWGCRGSPFYSNQDSTPSSTNESLTDICYAITVLYEKSTQNNLSINIWQIMAIRIHQPKGFHFVMVHAFDRLKSCIFLHCNSPRWPSKHCIMNNPFTSTILNPHLFFPYTPYTPDKKNALNPSCLKHHLPVFHGIGSSPWQCASADAS